MDATEGWDPLGAAAPPPAQAQWHSGVERLRGSAQREQRALVAALDAAGAVIGASGGGGPGS